MADMEFVVDFPTLGDLVDAWITRHCRQPDGFLRGTPFKLSDWQFWIAANRWRVRPDVKFVPLDEVTTDRPLVLNQAFWYRMSLIVGPQKTGKGPLTAAFACAEVWHSLSRGEDANSQHELSRGNQKEHFITVMGGGGPLPLGCHSLRAILPH